MAKQNNDPLGILKNKGNKNNDPLGIKKKVETSQPSKTSAGKPSGSLQALTSGLEKSQASSGKAVNLLGQQTGVPVTQQVSPSTAPLKPTKEQIVPLDGTENINKGLDVISKTGIGLGNQLVQAPLDSQGNPIQNFSSDVKNIYSQPTEVSGGKNFFPELTASLEQDKVVKTPLPNQPIGTQTLSEKPRDILETEKTSSAKEQLRVQAQDKINSIVNSDIEKISKDLGLDAEQKKLLLDKRGELTKSTIGDSFDFQTEDIDKKVSEVEKFIEDAYAINTKRKQASDMGVTLEDVMYFDKKQNAEKVLDLLPDDMKEQNKELFRITSSMRDLLTEYNVKVGDNGELDLSSIKDSQTKRYLDEKLGGYLKEYDKLLSSSYNVMNDKIIEQKNQIKDYEMLIKKVESLKGNAKTYEEKKRVETELAKAKEKLYALKQDTYQMQKSKNSFFATDPNSVKAEFKSSESAKTLFSALPKDLSPKDKFDLFYSQLAEKNEVLAEKLGIDDTREESLNAGAKDWLDWDGIYDLSKEEKEYYNNKKMLRDMATIYLNNSTGLSNKSSGFIESFMASAANWIQPNTEMRATETTIAKGQLEGLKKAGFSSKDLTSEKSVKQLEKRIEEVPFFSMETAGEMLGTTGAIMAELIVGDVVLAPLKATKAVKTMATAYDKAMDSSKVLKFIKPAVDQGIKMEAVGTIFSSAEDELNFTSGALGGLGGELVGVMAKKLGSETLSKYISSVFGSQSDKAMYVLKRAGEINNRGLGEVGEEVTQELVGIYNDELRTKGFWDEVSSRYGNLSDIGKLVVSSYIMGSAFGMNTKSSAKEWYNSLPKEEKAIIDTIEKDVNDDVVKSAEAVVEKKAEIIDKESEEKVPVTETPTEAPIEMVSEEKVSAEKTDVTDTNVGDIVKPKIETVEGAESKTTYANGDFVLPGELEKMTPEELSKITFINPSQEKLDIIEKAFPTQKEVVKEQIEPIKEQAIPTEKVAETQATEVVDGETDVNKEERVNYRVDDVNADNYGDVVFNNPNYVARGGAGNKATEGYYSWDRSEAKQYADGNEDNLFEGELKPDSKILELETNDPENYQENADAISEFEKITGMTYDSESFSNITNKEIKSLKKAGYDAVRGATIDGLATVVVNKDSITPLNQQPTPSVEQIDTQEKRVEKTTENVQTEEKPSAEKTTKTNEEVSKELNNVISEINTRVSEQNPDAQIMLNEKDGKINVNGLYVGEDKRSQGIGSKVLSDIKSEADKIGKVVTLKATDELGGDVEKLEAFYAKNGFEKVGDNIFEYDPNKVSAEKSTQSKTESLEEKESPKEKVSKQAERAADMQDNEIGKRLREISRYEVQNQEEHLGVAKEIVKLAGGEREAIQYVNDPKNRVNAEVKEAVMMVASGEIVTKAEIMKTKALEKGDAEMLAQAESDIEEGLMYVRDVSLEGTKMGQRNAFKKKIYEAYPMMYNLSNKDRFTKKWGATTEQQEDINELQQNIQKEVDRIIDEEFSNDETVDKLKEEIEKLKSELEKEKSKKSSKSEAKAEKIKDIQKKRKDLFSELKKERRGGNISASIFGLTSRQIELIGEIVKTYIQEGYTRADKIVSDIYFNLKDDVEGIRKEHIRTIAREIEEFESLHKQEVDKNRTGRVDKLKEKLAKLQKGNEDVSLEVKDSDTDEIKDLKKQIKDEQVLSPKVLKDLMKQHFAGKNPNYRTFAEAIAQKTGKTTAEVQDLADVIEERIKMKVEDMVKREHKKFVEQSKKVAENPTIKALKEKKLKGIATKEELELLDKKLEDSKSRKEVNQIMKLLSMGSLLNSSDFTRAFEQRFGFKQLSSTTQKQVDALANEIFELTRQAELEVTTSKGTKKGLSATQKMRVGMLQKKLNTILEANKPFTTARVIKEIVSAIYVNMLSGILTFARAGIGGYGSGFLGTGAYLVNNLINPLKWGTNIPALGKGLTAMIESMPSAYIRATQARKTGYDVFKDSALKGERSTENMGWYEKTLLSGLNEAYSNKEWGKVVVKSFGQALKVIHALGALDAFMNTMTGSFVGTTESAKKGEFDKLMNGDLYDIATNEWNDFKKSIEELVNIQNPNFSAEEKSSAVDRIIRQELGIAGSRFKAKKVFVTNRVQELREANLGEFFEQGVSLSKDASMMGQPDGMGGLIAQGLGNISNIKDDDKALIAILKLIPNLIFKFGRITGQAINKSFNNIPVLGIANAYFGVGYNPKTGELEYGDLNQRYKSNPLLFKQRLASNLLVTATTLVAFASMFNDDDEEGLTLDPNRPFDLRGFGNTSQGGKAKNERLYEGYRNLSISFTRDKDGNFTNYIELKLLPDLAGIAATIGYYADILKGDVKFSEDADIQKAKLDEFRKNAYSTSTIFKALSQNTKLVTESSFSSIAGLKRNYEQGDDLLSGLGYVARGIAMDNVKPLIEPRVIESIITTVSSVSGIKEKELKDWQYFAKNLYGADAFFEDNKTDVFGNEYVKENDYEKFLKETFGAGEKRSDKFKEFELLYKFNQGANISKRQFNEMKPDSKSGFVLSGPSPFGRYSTKYISMDDKIPAEAQKIQETYFRQLVLENYDMLNSVETKEELEEELKALQEESTQYAKEEIVSKYEGTKKIIELTE